MSAPTIEDFDKVLTGPKGWVDEFITNLKPGEITESPISKKSTGVMLKTRAAAMGYRLQTIERDEKLYVLLRGAQDAPQAAAEAPRRRTAKAS